MPKLTYEDEMDRIVDHHWLKCRKVALEYNGFSSDRWTSKFGRTHWTKSRK